MGFFAKSNMDIYTLRRKIGQTMSQMLSRLWKDGLRIAEDLPYNQHLQRRRESSLLIC
jgi:hypothetical protein